MGAYSIQRLLHTATEQPVAVTASYVLGVERAAPRGTRAGGRQRAPLLRATRRPLGQASCQELLPLVACRSADKVQYRSRLRAGQELPRGPRGILMRSDACAPRRVLWRAVRHLRVGWHGACVCRRFRAHSARDARRRASPSPCLVLPIESRAGGARFGLCQLHRAPANLKVGASASLRQLVAER